MDKYRNPHGQLKENLFLPLFTDLPINYRFDNMRGKARDILILKRITDFSTTGSAGLKRRNNGRNQYSFLYIIYFWFLLLLCLLHLCFRFDILKSGKETFRRDGINTIKYDRLTLDFKRLFTYILVTVNQTEIESVSKYSKTCPCGHLY